MLKRTVERLDPGQTSSPVDQRFIDLPEVTYKERVLLLQVGRHLRNPSVHDLLGRPLLDDGDVGGREFLDMVDGGRSERGRGREVRWCGQIAHHRQGRRSLERRKDKSGSGHFMEVGGVDSLGRAGEVDHAVLRRKKERRGIVLFVWEEEEELVWFGFVEKKSWVKGRVLVG